MRSLLVIESKETTGTGPAAAVPKSLRPEFRLRACGYAVTRARTPEQAHALIEGAAAAVLHLPLSAIREWGTTLPGWKVIPVFWWCSERTAALSAEQCEDGIMVDGILTPGMKPFEVHWALQFGAKQCFERLRWQTERRQLLEKIEERKWIEMAKGILCKVKRISEAEANDLLRRRAMDERKRIVDVATSIVQAYQLVWDNKKGGRKR